MFMENLFAAKHLKKGFSFGWHQFSFRLVSRSFYVAAVCWGELDDFEFCFCFYRASTAALIPVYNVTVWWNEPQSQRVFKI